MRIRELVPDLGIHGLREPLDALEVDGVPARGEHGLLPLQGNDRDPLDAAAAVEIAELRGDLLR